MAGATIARGLFLAGAADTDGPLVRTKAVSARAMAAQTNARLDGRVGGFSLSRGAVPGRQGAVFLRLPLLPDDRIWWE